MDPAQPNQLGRADGGNRSQAGGVRRPRPTAEVELPARDHLRRLRRVWAKHPVYFLTCCTHCRQRVLASPVAAAALVGAWRESPRVSGWTVGRYVIMPDHVHFFASAQAEAKPLGAWLRDWKRWTARQLAAQAGVPPPLWQPEFFDHGLRSAASYAEKWHYVWQNPVRAGLVTTPEAWPYAGECEPLTF
jgi:putative transposase